MKLPDWVRDKKTQSGGTETSHSLEAPEQAAAVAEHPTPHGYHKIVGIDLGTNSSVVAAWNNETGKAEVFDVPSHWEPTCIFPSVVSVSRQGKILVGWQARRNLAANPQNTIVEVKRLMGDPQELDLGDRKFTPQMISAIVLENLKTMAEAKVGSPIHDAVITVPADFRYAQRQATCDAARMAGLNPRLLINEPIAAVIGYGLGDPSDEERIYIVYDLGASTLDVSVIRAGGGNIEVVGTARNDHLGGGDFDNAISQWVFDQIAAQWPGTGALAQDKYLWARVKGAAEQAKIELSAGDTSVIEVPNLTPEINVRYEINRDTFNHLLKDPRTRGPGQPQVGLLDATFQPIEEAVAAAAGEFAERYKRGKPHQRKSFDMSDVSALLLVGGSTRVPIVREMLVERSNRPVVFNPEIVDKAVATGAAIIARAAPLTEPNEGPYVTWRALKLGGYKSDQELSNALTANGCRLNFAASEILKKTMLGPTATEIELVNVSVRELGFEEGGGFADIYRRAQEEFSLDLVQAEAGFQLRLQYSNQPMGERLLIAMEPINGSVLLVQRSEDAPWIYTDTGRHDYWWHPTKRWVFARRKQS